MRHHVHRVRPVAAEDLAGCYGGEAVRRRQHELLADDGAAALSGSAAELHDVRQHPQLHHGHVAVVVSSTRCEQQRGHHGKTHVAHCGDLCEVTCDLVISCCCENWYSLYDVKTSHDVSVFLVKFDQMVLLFIYFDVSYGYHDAKQKNWIEWLRVSP